MTGRGMSGLWGGRNGGVGWWLVVVFTLSVQPRTVSDGIEWEPVPVCLPMPG